MVDLLPAYVNTWVTTTFSLPLTSHLSRAPPRLLQITRSLTGYIHRLLHMECKSGQRCHINQFYIVTPDCRNTLIAIKTYDHIFGRCLTRSLDQMANTSK